MLKKYFSIGVINTIIHWIIFSGCFILLNINQSISNLLAFIIAVTFSFFMNAKFTFNKRPTGIRYILFAFFIGGLSFMTGRLEDQFSIKPIITLIAFSLLSFTLGFLYSKYVVFK